MNSTDQNGDRVGYRVMLLLVVGLTAFSSAMNELNQLQQFTLDASRVIAQWSAKFVPAQVPAVPYTAEATQAIAKVETCELTQSLPSVALPWLSSIARARTVRPRAVVPRPSQIIDFKKDLPQLSELQLAKLKKLSQIDFEPVQFDITVTTDAGPAPVVFSELPGTSFKAKTRHQRDIRMNPRDREILLKNLNRGINLRIAG